MASREDWTAEELRAAVDAYLDMLRLHRAGKPFVKKQYYRDLAARFGRTAKAFEYRAQNISHVLALQGRQWLPGLVPAANVGPNVTAQLETILATAEGVNRGGSATFESKVRTARKRKSRSKPKGNKQPKTSTGNATSFDRDPEVKAWVLNEANGRCESCAQPAPFANLDNEPFLEVHHVCQLADGGSDTVENAAALCPNCHRALHYAIDSVGRRRQLYERLHRLVEE